MIPAGVEVFIALVPIDLRWSFDRLAGLVEGHLGREARGGALFVFFGKRRCAIKVLFFDGTGMCLFYKRLDTGLFTLPDPSGEDGRCIEVEPHVLDELLDGVSVEPKRRPARNRKAPVH